MKKMTGRLLSISAALLLLTNSVTALADQGGANIVSAASVPESAREGAHRRERRRRSPLRSS